MDSKSFFNYPLSHDTINVEVVTINVPETRQHPPKKGSGVRCMHPRETHNTSYEGLGKKSPYVTMCDSRDAVTKGLFSQLELR